MCLHIWFINTSIVFKYSQCYGISPKETVSWDFYLYFILKGQCHEKGMTFYHMWSWFVLNNLVAELVLHFCNPPEKSCDSQNDSSATVNPVYCILSAFCTATHANWCPSRAVLVTRPLTVLKARVNTDCSRCGHL